LKTVRLEAAFFKLTVALWKHDKGRHRKSSAFLKPKTLPFEKEAKTVFARTSPF
jgi:hypothetical protein